MSYSWSVVSIRIIYYSACLHRNTVRNLNMYYLLIWHVWFGVSPASGIVTMLTLACRLEQLRNVWAFLLWKAVTVRCTVLILVYFSHPLRWRAQPDPIRTSWASCSALDPIAIHSTIIIMKPTKINWDLLHSGSFSSLFGQFIVPCIIDATFPPVFP